MRHQPAAVYQARSGANGEWLQVSAQIEGILGFTAADFLADPGLWERQLHPEDYERVMAGEQEHERGGTESAYDEYRMFHRDGTVVWVLDEVTLMDDDVDGGTIQHGLLYNITRRKRAELLVGAQAEVFERVASGADLTETLRALAVSVTGLTGATACTVVVQPAATEAGEVSVVVGGAGTAAGPARQPVDRTPVHDMSGELLGHIGLEGASAQEGLEWATQLVAFAVGHARQEQRTALSHSLLEATLESTADGIVVVTHSGRIASYNQKFLKMWQIPEHLIQSGGRALMSYVTAQLTDPAAFLDELARLDEGPEHSSADKLEFRDGRVFERYSQPQRINGESVGRVWSFRDMTSYRQLESELRRQAHTDPLTALPNRARLMERLTETLERSAGQRRGTTVAVLLIDVDDFKTVNDSLGHVVGDLLLTNLAARLSGCLRSQDMAARLGGDEFVVLLDGIKDPDHAVALAERVVKALAEPIDVDGRCLSVRTSIGIALAGAGTLAGELVRNADLAMYAAKASGGGGHQLYAAGMHTEAMARLDLSAALSAAIEGDELEVHYQPVINLESGQITGFEALTRWHHPQRGPISPEEFITLAEENGLIDGLGRWVLAHACAEAAGWSRTCAAKAPTVSVNLSARQLSNPRLVEEIREILAATGLRSDLLYLEITETALVHPYVDVIAVLRDIMALGVRLSLDDFGTGYSSLGRLGLYPFQVLKVDQSFVGRIGEDSGGLAVVEAVLRLADAFDLDVVAEGIETEEQLQALLALGCRGGQGYLFSRPVPAAEARALLGQGISGE
ncbi:MAG: EAL domain-containing protein [Nocardioides sp.]